MSCDGRAETAVDSDVYRLVSHIKNNIPALERLAPDNYEYSGVPLCAIDAVYSIGIRYSTVIKIVDNYCEWSNWEKDRKKAPQEYETSELLAVLSKYEKQLNKLAEEIFQSRHRTSSKNGILKAEAVYQFSKALQRHGIETFADAMQHREDPELEEEIKRIPGQGSGLSLAYFRMLVGDRDIVKADRMVQRFVACGIGKSEVRQDYAKQLVIGASAVLHSEFSNLTPSVLDNAIWNYEQKHKVTR
jgi:hypothetical protein